MAYEAFEIDDMGMARIVYADDPTLDPHQVYHCSGTDMSGKKCLCPVHLVLGSERISPHFRQASQELKHINGCSHAEESPYHQIMHLDLSGQGLSEQDLLDIGSRDGANSRRRDKQPPERDPDNQGQGGKQDDDYDDRQLQVVHKNPTNIRQLYLILCAPEVMAYAGHKIVELLVSSKTLQYHRNHLPTEDGVKLVVAEACFAKDMIPPGRNTFLMQDPYWKEGGKKVSDEKRLRYVVQVSNAQYSSICNLLTNAKGKRYLILGDWKYDAATNTYRCELKKSATGSFSGQISIAKAFEGVSAWALWFNRMKRSHRNEPTFIPDGIFMICQRGGTKMQFTTGPGPVPSSPGRPGAKTR